MQSYVTFASNDYCAKNALVLANSLKASGSEKLVTILVTDGISNHIKNVLVKTFDNVIHLNEISFDQGFVDAEFNKIKVWLLTQFTKCVYIESDVLVLENIDDLFIRNEFSAVANPEWPSCFDVGVFVFEPNVTTYHDIISYTREFKINKTIECLLNLYYHHWGSIEIENKIPFIYNCQPNLEFYTHSSALTRFGQHIKVARLGKFDLSNINSNIDMKSVGLSVSPFNSLWNEIWLKWWKIFNEMVKPCLEQELRTCFNITNIPKGDFQRTDFYYPHHQVQHQCDNIPSENPNESLQEQQCQFPNSDAEDISTTNEGGEATPTNKIEDDKEKEQDHRLKWERGEIDYMGEDRFDHILAVLNLKLEPGEEENDNHDSNIKKETVSNSLKFDGDFDDIDDGEDILDVVKCEIEACEVTSDSEKVEE